MSFVIRYSFTVELYFLHIYVHCGKESIDMKKID